MNPELNVKEIFVKADNVTTCGPQDGFKVCIDGIERHYPINNIKFLCPDEYAAYVLRVLRKVMKMPEGELARVFGVDQVQKLIMNEKFTFSEIERTYEEWENLRFGDVVTAENDYWIYKGICLLNVSDIETDDVPILVLTDVKKEPRVVHASKDRIFKTGHVDFVSPKNIKKYCSSKGKKHDA